MKPVLQAQQLPTVDVTALREYIQGTLQAKFPGQTSVQIANNVSYSGTKYVVLCGGGLFFCQWLDRWSDIIWTVASNSCCALVFSMKSLSAWSGEHLRSHISLRKHEL